LSLRENRLAASDPTSNLHPFSPHPGIGRYLLTPSPQLQSGQPEGRQVASDWAFPASRTLNKVLPEEENSIAVIDIFKLHV